LCSCTSSRTNDRAGVPWVLNPVAENEKVPFLNQRIEVGRWRNARYGNKSLGRFRFGNNREKGSRDGVDSHTTRSQLFHERAFPLPRYEFGCDQNPLQMNPGGYSFFQEADAFNKKTPFSPAPFSLMQGPDVFD
jgi:hypothetical protein